MSIYKIWNLICWMSISQHLFVYMIFTPLEGSSFSLDLPHCPLSNRNILNIDSDKNIYQIKHLITVCKSNMETDVLTVNSLACKAIPLSRELKKVVEEFLFNSENDDHAVCLFSR